MTDPTLFRTVLENGTPVLDEGAGRLFPWWSVTKSVLAACALRLVQTGKLELETPLPGRPYSLRQLLQHRAGLRCYGPLEDYHAAVAHGDSPFDRAFVAEGRDEFKYTRQYVLRSADLEQHDTFLSDNFMIKISAKLYLDDADPR